MYDKWNYLIGILSQLLNGLRLFQWTEKMKKIDTVLEKQLKDKYKKDFVSIQRAAWRKTPNKWLWSREAKSPFVTTFND